MRARLLILLLILWPASAVAQEGTMETTPLIDFSGEDQELWSSINDSVMGGRSRSRMHSVDGIAVFEGFVSMENNGGFCSVRSQAERQDLSAYEGLRIRVRGDGQRYAFRIRTDARWDGVSYQVKFDAPDDEWAWVLIPFDEFIPVYRGRRVQDWPALNPAQVHTLGLLIADKQEGAFRLEIQKIEGYAGKASH